MWFNRSASGKSRDYPLAGMNHYLDGQTAAATVESSASDALLLRAATDFDPVWNTVKHLQSLGKKTVPGYLQRAAMPATLINRAAGLAATGKRTGVLTDSLDGIHETLATIAGRRLPLVLYLSCKASRRQADSRHGSHDEYHASAASGWFQFFAGTPQEVADLGLIAHRLAETAMSPGMVAQDCYSTSHGIHLLQLPGKECIEAFLGRSGDSIAAPTPAQSLLFGEQRRRVPVLVNLDAPAGLGLIQGQESYYPAAAAQRPFFYDHIETLAGQAMQAYGELTGRFYSPLAEYLVDDAEYLVLAQGAITQELRHLVDRLREAGKIKAGALGLTMLRPFPGARLTHLLKGKKALTVLERIDQPLAEDLPLLVEVRAALDKAHENARAQGTNPPYPAYASFTRPTDRPALFSGIYGVGTDLPSAALLYTVFTNMTAGGNGSKRFYLGKVFSTPDRRFPQLQTVWQQVQKYYPGINKLSLGTAESLLPPSANTRTIQLMFGSVQGGLLAVNTLAQALAYVHHWKPSTYPGLGYSEDLQEAGVTLHYSRGEDPPGARPDTCDTLLVASPDLLATPSLCQAIAGNGSLIIQTELAHQDLWNRFSPELKEHVRERQLRVATIAGNPPAAGIASSITDELTPWTLLGAGLESAAALSAEGPGSVCEYLGNQLLSVHGLPTESVTEIIKTLRRAAKQITLMNWQGYADNRDPVSEVEGPWNLATGDAPEADKLFNARKFWHSVGYLYRTGQTDQLVADPSLATGLVPAGSSTGRDLSPRHTSLPIWQPEKCTGCGQCWTLCPESALPSALYSVQSILAFAIHVCEEKGKPLIQMKRLQDALTKQTYLIVQRDGLHQFRMTDKLLAEAFRQLLEKMEVTSQQLATLKEEFKLLNECYAQFSTAKTDLFFDRPHSQAKGSGTLLAITLNPATCTACGLCSAVCPEQAFEWQKLSPERLSDLRHSWKLQMSLPETDEKLLESVCNGGSANAAINRLLRKSAYLAMGGGDGSVPGNIAKSVAHILTATVESVMQPRFADHVARLDSLMKALQEGIQGNLVDAVRINDFDDFAHRLSHLGRERVSPDKIFGLFSGDRASSPEHQARLLRMTALLELLLDIRDRYATDAGNGRARMILVPDPEAAHLWNGSYPYNPHANPWISLQPAEATGLAEGLYAGTCSILLRELEICRSATAELEDSHHSRQVEPIFEEISIENLTPTEHQLLPPVLVLCRSESLSHTGLRRILSSHAPVLVAMIENDALPITPGSPGFHGGDQPGLHALLYPDSFVLQSSASHPDFIIQGVVDALASRQPSLLYIYAPDHPVGPATATRTLEGLKLASDSRLFPAFTARHEEDSHLMKVSLRAEDATIDDWVCDSVTIRTPSGTESTVNRVLTAADWALHENRYPEHFRILSIGHLNSQMLPLPDYLELSIEQREGLEPYIVFVDHNRQQKIAVVSEALVNAARSTRDLWRHLQLLGSLQAKQPVVATAEPAIAQADAEPASAVDLSAPPLQAVTERLLALCGYSGNPDYFRRSLREFIGRGTSDHRNSS